MITTQFCDRYRERNVANPREMLALRNTKVDLSKWEPVSFGHTPPGGSRPSPRKDLSF